jgi:hypothetical protein
MIGDQQPTSLPLLDGLSWVSDLLEGVLDMRDVTLGTEKELFLRLRGRLLIDSRAAYARLAPALRARGYVLLMRREGDLSVLSLVQARPAGARPRLLVNLLLAAATVVSVLYAYALYWSGMDLRGGGLWPAMQQGLGFAAGMLGILLAHEMGHYAMARYLGVSVTLPFLIPFPLSPMGTMGAVITMRDLPPSRRAMLLIGMAGPLAGLLVALPVLLYGLHLSRITLLPPGGGYMAEGNSLLYLALKALVFHRLLPSGGLDVDLHPLAFAGWSGLLVTSFNLIPAGQLDGGHIAAAVLGARARVLVWPIIGVLLVLGIWWQGWFLWAGLIWLFSRRQAQPLDDISRLTRAEVAVALCWLLVFVLVFIPIPLRLV